MEGIFGCLAVIVDLSRNWKDEPPINLCVGSVETSAGHIPFRTLPDRTGNVTSPRGADDEKWLRPVETKRLSGKPSVWATGLSRDWKIDPPFKIGAVSSKTSAGHIPFKRLPDSTGNVVHPELTEKDESRGVKESR